MVNPAETAQLVQRGSGLWTVDGPMRVPGLELGTRTTVIRLTSGEVVLISPGRNVTEVAGAIRALGPVRGIIAPNLFHHLFIEQAQACFPDARLYGPPGLAKKRTDLAIDEHLTGTPPNLWAAEIDQVLVAGAPRVQETAFFHRLSKSLVLSDLAFNLEAATNWWGRFVYRLLDVGGGFGPSRLGRLIYRDKAAWRQSLREIQAWPFERIVVAHGEIVEEDARQVFAAAFGLTEA